jgi:hypothetical protein
LSVLRVLFWVFFAPARLKAASAQRGREPIRRIMGWPLGTMIWLPLVVPLLSIDLGIFRAGFASPEILRWLHIAVLIGWVSFGLLGRFMPVFERFADPSAVALPHCLWRSVQARCFCSTGCLLVRMHMARRGGY